MNKSILHPDIPLFQITDFIEYWNIWYQTWEGMYHNNLFKKNKTVLGWALPHFFGNAHKTIISYKYSPQPYQGNLALLNFDKVILRIHPLLVDTDPNEHLFLNVSHYNHLKYNTLSDSEFRVNLIPWRSFFYHTDIAEYLYDTRYLKQSPNLVEFKILIPLIILVSEKTEHKRIYTESNYIYSLLLVNKFQFIDCLELFEGETIIEDNIKYKCFSMTLNEMVVQLFCKTY